ncbi:MAG: GntR family transcriptional regulator [Rhodospirillales bacterium]|nr:GntR family transcriptional regulator [Rhodospirillales bacterium]
MQPLRCSTLGRDAYTAVRAVLLDGVTFAPGAKISVEDMARRLGVSRSPLWAAIARLEAEGIVDVVPRQGVFLSRCDPMKLTALFEAREALEGMAARLAAGRRDESHLASMAAAVTEQQGCARRGERGGYHHAARAFHEVVSRAAASPEIDRLLSGLYGRGQAMCSRLPPPPDRWAGACADHAALLEALHQRDGDAAERIARAHVHRLAQAALDALVPA